MFVTASHMANSNPASIFIFKRENVVFRRKSFAKGEHCSRE
jgi:hypothetical protein